MSGEDLNLVEMRTQLMENIGTSISQVIQHKEADTIINQISAAIIECNYDHDEEAAIKCEDDAYEKCKTHKNPIECEVRGILDCYTKHGMNPCDKCLNIFFNKEELVRFSLEKPLSKHPKTKNLYNSLCDTCNCKASASFKNKLVLRSDTNFSQMFNNDDIVTKINGELKKQYGDIYPESPKNSKNISELITSIKTEVTQNLDQIIRMSQVVKLSGHGTISNVNMEMVVLAIMRSIASSSTAVKIVTEMTNEIAAKSLKNDPITGTGGAGLWDEVKWTVIIGSSIIFVLIIILIIV